MKSVLLTLGFFALAAYAQLPGQYPGTGYPYPGGPLPGQYPGGPYPGGPFPGPNPNPVPNNGPNGRSGRRGRGRDSGSRTSSKDAPVITTTAGMLRRATSNQLVIQADDHRIVWYKLTGQTSYEKSGKDADVKSFGLGDRVSVDSSSDDDGNLTAVAVRWVQAATADDLVAALKTSDLPSPSASAASDSSSRDFHEDGRPILRRANPQPSPQPKPDQQSPKENQTAQPNAAPPSQAPQPQASDQASNEDTRPATELRLPNAQPDAGDPGPPELRRGKPTPQDQAERASKEATAVATAAPPPAPVKAPQPQAPQPRAPQQADASPQVVRSGDTIIDKARQAAASFMASLPNFFCQQVTTRYRTSDAQQGWTAIDIVSADLTYDDGHESYKNIKVGNRPVNKSMDEIGGTRSTGEFASEMEDLMSQQSGATFRRRGEDTIRGRSAWLYDFQVPREQSHWRIEAPSMLYYPAYKGSIWIDKQTSRILRIEQQSSNMPALFPFDTVEAATDYDFVRLSPEKEFLLPVEAQVLNCQRGTSECSRNKIEFRNYRKFGSDTNITFGDPAAPK